VEKKGFVYLIDACDRLARRGVDIRCTIAGSGPLEDELRARIAARDLVDRVTLTGTALTQEDLPGFMAIGDAFCLPCVRASDNDVDGLPQVLMEAMACGLPAVSTRLVGIPDLVIHEETGLLVPPGAAERVADALHRLKEDPELATRLAEAGQRHAREHFDIRTSLQPMLMLFRRRLAAADQRPEPAEPAALATETEDGGSVALPGRGAPAHRTTTARLGAARRRSPR
jgi:glycosyltransferase involved in cell wall biosynthesis